MKCSCCGGEVLLAAASDAELKSERGRRNSGRRKSFRGWPKGRRVVWKTHSDIAWRCRCPACLTGGVAKLELELARRIKTQVTAAGAEPDWAATERQRLHALRTEIEAAIAERRRAWARAAGPEAQEVASAAV